MRILEIKTTHSMDKNLFINTDLTDEQILDVVNDLKRIEIEDDFYLEKVAYLNALVERFPNNNTTEVIKYLSKIY